MSIKIGINGFGRIGRYIFRTVFNDPDIEIVAINDLMEPEILAHLLEYDSIHRRFEHVVESGKECIIINGKKINITNIKNPAELPWNKFDVDIAIEATGIFCDRENALKHLNAGAKKVIISAPAESPDITIVIGINENSYHPDEHHIISNASCTTNCLAPVLKVIMDNFSFRYGMMTTIHSYTRDQSLLDFPHEDLRRARAGALSMVPTTTGAIKAIVQVMPEMKDRLTGLSIRVPTPNVSIIDLVITVNMEDINPGDVNRVFKENSKTLYKGIIGYSDLPLVSIDYIGSPYSAVIDARNTDITGNMLKIIAWYDNEAGYSNRIVDLIKIVGSNI